MSEQPRNETVVTSYFAATILLMTTEEKWLLSLLDMRRSYCITFSTYNSSNFFIVNLLVIYSAEKAEYLAPSRFLPGGQTSFGKAIDNIGNNMAEPMSGG